MHRSAVADAVRHPGRPLAEPVRADMEGRLGSDFSDVRVHDDAAAHASARSLSADAYTVGSHIVFQQGRYNSATAAGKILLAHELAHVIQQRQGPVAGRGDNGLSVSDPGDPFERAATQVARTAMARPSPTLPAALRLGQRAETGPLIREGHLAPATVQRSRADYIQEFNLELNKNRSGITRVTQQVEQELMNLALANAKSGEGFRWAAGAHNTEWVNASQAGEMFAQSSYAQQFGGWLQGPGLYFALTSDPVKTVSWAKDDMAQPSLMKVELKNVPTIDLSNKDVLGEVQKILKSSSPGMAKNDSYKVNIPILLLYGNGTVGRLSTGVGVTLTTDMKSFLTRAQVQQMLKDSKMANVQGVLSDLSKDTDPNWA